MRHPRCVGSITKNFVYYKYNRTQLYFTQQYSKYTTTCFGPICGPSSGCDLTYTAAIQDVWGVFYYTEHIIWYNKMNTGGLCIGKAQGSQAHPWEM